MGEPETIEHLAAKAFSSLYDKDLSASAFYGHSMGGHVVYEVCRMLLANHLGLPAAVILGASPAPGSIPDSGEALRILETCEPSLNKLPEYITERTAAGVQRACAYAPPKVALPIQLDILAGTRDELVNFERMRLWEDFCAPAPRYYQVDGGHLFHRSALDDFMVLLRQLVPCNASQTGTAAAS